jgi:hypothetical protein
MHPGHLQRKLQAREVVRTLHLQEVVEGGFHRVAVGEVLMLVAAVRSPENTSDDSK